VKSFKSDGTKLGNFTEKKRAVNRPFLNLKIKVSKMVLASVLYFSTALIDLYQQLEPVCTKQKNLPSKNRKLGFWANFEQKRAVNRPFFWIWNA